MIKTSYGLILTMQLHVSVIKPDDYKLFNTLFTFLQEFTCNLGVLMVELVVSEEKNINFQEIFLA